MPYKFLPSQLFPDVCPPEEQGRRNPRVVKQFVIGECSFISAPKLLTNTIGVAENVYNETNPSPYFLYTVIIILTRKGYVSQLISLMYLQACREASLWNSHYTPSYRFYTISYWHQGKLINFNNNNGKSIKTLLNLKQLYWLKWSH